jgi:hypothetical protein
MPKEEPAMKPPIGKRRTREHVIADLSINFVERQALLCGFTVETIYKDYGIDLELKTYNEVGEREPGGVLFQVKATDGMSLREGQADFPARIQKSDLKLWLREKSPVILIVFDAQRTKAYWCYIQQYFQRLKDFNLFAAGETITVRVRVANRLNPAAMRRFARFRDRINDQMNELYYD